MLVNEGVNEWQEDGRTYSTTVFWSSAGNLEKTDAGSVCCESSSSGSCFAMLVALMMDCLRVSGAMLSSKLNLGSSMCVCISCRAVMR
jgi:hypothetical protein